MATKKTWRGGQWVDVPVDNSGKEITGTPTADKPQTTPATSSGSRDTNSIIQQAYHNVLGRAPDPTGQAYYSGILGREPQTGLSQLETALKASDEYKNKPQELSSPDQNNLAGYNETNPVVNSSTEYRSYTNQLKADIDAYELSSQETLAQLAEMSQGKPQEALDKEISEIESKINVDRQHIAEQKKLADEQENLEEKSYTQGMKDVGVDVRQLNIEIAKNQRTLNHKKLELSYQREIQLLNDNRMSQVDRAKKEWEQGNYEMAKWAMDSAMDIEDRLNDKKQKLWDAQMDYEDQQRKDLEAENEATREAFDFAMENDINKPFYTLDGYTYWDTSTGQEVSPEDIGNPDLVSIIDSSQKIVKFDRVNVDGKQIRFGFNAAGEIVSRTVLGSTKSGGSSSSSSSSGMTDKQQRDADVLLKKVENGLFTKEQALEKASDAAFDYVEGQLPDLLEKREADEAEQLVEGRLDRLEQFESGTGTPNIKVQLTPEEQQTVARLYRIKFGHEEGDFEEAFINAVTERSKYHRGQSNLSDRIIRSRFAKGLEFIQGGK